MRYQRSSRQPFTVISNALAQDNTISFECRGMLLYLLSKPDDWQGRPRDIEREGDIGEKKRRKLTKDAEKAGYMAFRKVQDPLTGFFDQWYEVFDQPLPIWERTKSWTNPSMQELKSQVEPPPPLPGGGGPGGGEPTGRLRGGPIKERPDKRKTQQKREAVPASTIQLLEEKTGLPTETCELILEDNPALDLVSAALECWGERNARIKDKTGENPVGFLRGVLGHPGAFGLVQGLEGWYYPKVKASDRRSQAILETAKRRIISERKAGKDDRTIFAEMGTTYKDEVSRKAFKELEESHANV